MIEHRKAVRFSPDAARLCDAKAVLAESAPRVGDDATAAGKVLSAAGQLCLMGERQAAQGLLQRTPGSAKLIERALSSVEWEALEVAAAAIVELAPDLELAEDDAGNSRQRILDALASRTRVEELLVGAEALPGSASALPEDGQVFLDEFELLVRPNLFRLVAMNQERAAALAWVAPDERPRLWWYAYGVDVPAHALDALSDAAHLLEVFPEAEAELERLRRAERVLRGAWSQDARGQALRARDLLSAPLTILNTRAESANAAVCQRMLEDADREASERATELGESEAQGSEQRGNNR